MGHFFNEPGQDEVDEWAIASLPLVSLALALRFKASAISTLAGHVAGVAGEFVVVDIVAAAAAVTRWPTTVAQCERSGKVESAAIAARRTQPNYGSTAPAEGEK